MSLLVFYSRLLKSLLLSFMSVVELSIKIITITFVERSDYYDVPEVIVVTGGGVVTIARKHQANK